MRVLVSPASTHGGTAQIGRAIARVLRDSGIDVDVTQPEDIHDLSPYAGFVIGSALYRGSWLPAAASFLEANGGQLMSRPTWLFSSGPIDEGLPENPIDQDTVERLVGLSGAEEHRLFGGRIEIDRLSAVERGVARWVHIEDRDERPWHEIEVWTADIARRLKAEQEPTRAGESTR